MIRPTNPTRRAAWLDLLQRETLPIVDYRARPGQYGDPVFDVALDRLNDQERARLAGFVAMQNNGAYAAALEAIKREGVAIAAVGCELLMQGNGD